MSLADELRTALAYKGTATAAEIAELCPSGPDTTKVASNLASFVARGEATKAAGADGKPTFTLVKDYQPGKKKPAPAKKAAKTEKPAKKKPKKPAKRSTRKPPPKAAAPAPESMLVAARKTNGEVIIYDRSAGTVDTLELALVEQISQLHVEAANVQ